MSLLDLFFHKKESSVSNTPVKVSSDTQTIVIMREQLEQFMQKEQIDSRAEAMEQMRNIMYKYISDTSQIPLDCLKEELTIKFEF